MQILYVDDEEKSRKYFSRIFGNTWEVVLAADGREALDILLGDGAERIGVVVTDQIMPGMTGIEMLARIRHRKPHLVKVLSTVVADSGLVARAAEAGVIDYFVGKPWTMAKLRNVLDQAMVHRRVMCERETVPGG